MPGGFFRGLAAVAKDTYNQVKAEVGAGSSGNVPPHGQYGHNNHQPYNQYNSQHNPQYGYGTNGYYGQQSHGPYNPQYENHQNNFQPNQTHPYGFSPPASPPQQQQYQQQQQQQHHYFDNSQYAQYAPHQQYASNERPPPIPPVNSHDTQPSPEQRAPQTPPQTPAPAAPVAAPQNQAQNTQSTGLFSFLPDPNNCDPQAKLSQSYYTASVPDFAVCEQCYDKHISKTCYAPLFKLEHFGPDTSCFCDLNVQAIQTAWTRACSRGMATSSPQEQQVWLTQFAQQFQEFQARINALAPEIQALVQDIQVSALQARFTQQSALIQIQGGMTSSIWGGGGAISTQIGNARFAESGQMQVEISKKRMRLGGLVEQLRAIYGPRLQVNL